MLESGIPKLGIRVHRFSSFFSFDPLDFKNSKIFAKIWDKLRKYPGSIWVQSDISRIELGYSIPKNPTSNSFLLNYTINDGYFSDSSVDSDEEVFRNAEFTYINNNDTDLFHN